MLQRLLQNKSLRRTNFSKTQLIAFALVFGLIGWQIYRSFAASPLVATLESEQMVLPSGGSVITDGSASAGKAIDLSTNGTATGSVNFPSSVSSITVIAKAKNCHGSPSMSVSLDGTSLLTNTPVSSTAWSGYSFTPTSPINAGTHSLAISFSNDFTKSGGTPDKQCSRDLYLDVTNFYGPTPAPTPAPTVSLSATPTSVTAGASSTLTWNSTNATSCSASGAWSGSQPTAGSASTGALNQSSTYNLTCTGAGGSGSASVSVGVGAGATIKAATLAHNTDGNLSESDWNVTTPAVKSVIGTNNNVTTFGTLWDNTYLYVGIKVQDSSLKNDSINCWDDDSVEFYIDANNNAGSTYDSYDRQFSKRWNDSNLCSGANVSGMLHAFANITGGYSVELAIPWSSLGVTPTTGMTIGLDVGNNDDDDGAGRDSQAVWNGTDQNYRDPSGFGKLSLSGTPLAGPGGGTPPPSISAGRFGYSAHILRMSDPQAYTQLVASGGGKTVRDDFAWSSIEPSVKGSFNWSGPDNIVRLTANAGLDINAMAGYAPTWATGCSGTDKCGPRNPADYADFVRQIALRYGRNGTFWTANPGIPKRPLAAIEVWNEPNIEFWINTNPASYTLMLKAGYSAIKSVDPTIVVVSAGLAPTGGYNDVDCNNVADSGYNGSTKMNPLNFLQAMYANGAAGFFDALGWHPYNFPGNGTATGMLAYHPCSAWSQMNSTPISVRSLMSANGDSAKKVWATELGAPTGGTPGAVSESAQADLAAQGMSLWKSYSWAGNYYWYDLRNDCTNSADRECFFGAVRYDNSLKPAYNALKNAWQ